MPVSSRRRWLRRLLLGAPFAAAGYGFGVEPRLLRTRRLRVGHEPSTRFAFFTDLHFKGHPGLLDRVVARIREARPDFVVFGGDLVEEREHLAAALERLASIGLPLYGVPGNHDYWSGIDFDPVHRAFEATGGGWLLDRAAELATAAGRIRIAGHTCNTDQVIAPEPGMKNLGLIHYPAWADRLPPGFDLILAGHSHGGQVRVPGVGALITPMGTGPYSWGRYRTPGGPLYVSSGIGTFFLNVRFLCPPEWVLVEW